MGTDNAKGQTPKVVIVDYRMGNVGSIINMFKRLGASAQSSSDPSVISGATHVVLPGVGAFDNGMQNIEELALLNVLNDLALVRRIPVLGICLGMQILTRGSEEGRRPGLGWLKAQTIKFRFDPRATGLKIPHMGWNAVSPRNGESLFRSHDPDGGFYFVHSFHVVCEAQEDVLATTQHGYDFVSAVQRGNIFGTQFHPEKSHRHGMQLLRNFVESISSC